MSSKREVKTKRGPTSQDKRREAALRRQKESRQDHLRNARNLVSGGPQQQCDNDVAEQEPPPQPIKETHQNIMPPCLPQQMDTNKKNSRGNRVRERRKFWASQVSTPEWMIEIPEGLNGQGSLIGSGWFVRPRPEGRRCMVIASDGKTWSRQLDGNILHRWLSSLPYGSPETNRGHGRSSKSENDFVLLDCVFDETTSSYWILDCMSWKQTSLYYSTAEFRLFWLHQQLLEECPNLSPPIDSGFSNESSGGGGGGATSSHVKNYPLKMCPYYDCTPEGLRAAYEGNQPFLRDGLIFYLKQGYYEPGSSPLLLQWKDSFSSRYLIYSTHQQAVLQVTKEEVDNSESSYGNVVRGWRFDQANQTSKNENNELNEESLMMNEQGSSHQNALLLSTLEGIIVGEVDLLFASSNQIEVGDLLKFDIDGVVEAEEEDQEDEQGTGDDKRPCCLLVNPRFKGKSSPNRPLPDSWSKLVFHSRARNVFGPTINEILERCQVPIP